MCVDDLCSCVRREFLGDKKICSCVRRDLQLSVQLEELKGSAAECADQNYGFCKELNKTQFY